MSENVNKFIDALHGGKNAEAGEAFKDALRDKVAQALDTARIDVAGKIFNGNHEAEAISDPKPAVTDPHPETDVIIDTQGNEVGAEPNQVEITPETPEAPASDESQPVNQ